MGALGRAKSKKTSTPEIALPDVVFRVCFYLGLGGAAQSRVPSFPAGTPPRTRREKTGETDQWDPEARITEKGRPKSIGVMEIWRPRVKEARKPTQKHKTSGHRYRFRLIPSCPTLTPQARFMGSIQGDSPNSRRHCRPPAQPQNYPPPGYASAYCLQCARGHVEKGWDTQACSPKYTSLSHLGHFGMAELSPTQVAATRRK